MIFRRGLLELEQRRVEIARIVQQVGEIHARFGELRIHREGTAQRHHGLDIVAQPVLRVADARHGFGRVFGVLHRPLEVGERLLDVALAEERATDLQHEVDVVFVAEFDGALIGAQPRLDLTELEQHLAQAGKRILVFGVERERLLEAATRPHEFVARQTRVAGPDVQLHCRRVQRESFAQQRERLVVLPLIVEGVSALVVFLGTQERVGHCETGLRIERVTG